MRQATVAKIESGTRPTSVGELILLAETLGVDPGDLLAHDGAATSYMQYKRTEAAVDAAVEKLSAAVSDVLEAQESFGKVFDGGVWAMDEVSFQMAGGLAPLGALVRQAIERHFGVKTGEIPADFLTPKENEIQNQFLSRYETDLAAGIQPDPILKYIRSVNGVDPEEA